MLGTHFYLGTINLSKVIQKFQLQLQKCLIYSIDLNDLIQSSSLFQEHMVWTDSHLTLLRHMGFLCVSFPQGLIYVVACIVHDNISMNSNINLASPTYEQWSTITYGWGGTERGREIGSVWRVWLLGEDGFLEGKVNYGSQSTWLKYQGRHTVIGTVSVPCQSAIFHRFVSLLEVKPIWASFINPKVLLLAGAGLSVPRGWGAQQRSATGRESTVSVQMCEYVCRGGWMCSMCMFAHKAHSHGWIHPSNRVTLTETVWWTERTLKSTQTQSALIVNKH